jgi:DNA-directed RNA polymerase subunit M/transcription elongation factor TFIIS
MNANVIKNVVAKKRMGLSTKIDSKILEAGVPMLVRFFNEEELRRHLATGLIQVTNALPPKEIKNIPVIKPPVIEEEIKLVGKDVGTPAIEKTTSANVNESGVNDVPVVERKSDAQNDSPSIVSDVSKVCSECNSMMIFTTDDKRPGIDLLYCPQCATEVIVSKPKESTEEASKTSELKPTEETSETKPKKVQSKCPKCGKRKAAASEFCKNCTAKILNSK